MSAGKRADELETLLQKEWRRVLEPQLEICYGGYLAVMAKAAEAVYKEPPFPFEKRSWLIQWAEGFCGPEID